MKCKICGKEFSRTSNNQLYCSTQCNDKSYYNRNKRKILNRINKYYLLNKEKVLDYKGRWYLLHKEDKHEYDKEYQKIHCKEIKIQRKEWYGVHKEQIREEHREYIRNRRRNDLEFRMRSNLSRRVSIALKSNPKLSTTMKLLGCSIEFFKNHLQSKFVKGMSFSNYGKWHIDHIRPCASFDLSKPEEQKKCFHYTNLQPLWAEENMLKRDNF